MSRAEPASRRGPLVNALLACGGLSSALYVMAIDVIAARRHPEYHRYGSQMVSELMAVGAPTRQLLVRIFIPYNLLVFLFAAGVCKVAGTHRLVRGTAVMLAGYGVLSSAGLLFAPMDLRGTVGSRRDPRHIAVTFVMSAFIVASMAVGAFANGVRFRLYSFATIAVVITFGVLAGVLARPMPGPTPGLGLVERVNIYATMLWMAVLGGVLARERGTGRRPVADDS